jgi:heme/copper-type cytochrome/quinol oxidase subunit 4
MTQKQTNAKRNQLETKLKWLSIVSMVLAVVSSALAIAVAESTTLPEDPLGLTLVVGVRFMFAGIIILLFKVLGSSPSWELSAVLFAAIMYYILVSCFPGGQPIVLGLLGTVLLITPSLHTKMKINNLSQ